MNHEGRDIRADFLNANHHVCGMNVPHARPRPDRGCPGTARASHPPGTQTCQENGCDPGRMGLDGAGGHVGKPLPRFRQQRYNLQLQILLLSIISMLERTHSGSGERLIGKTFRPNSEPGITGWKGGFLQNAAGLHHAVGR